MFVADASVTLAWCFADETSSSLETLLDRLIDGEEVLVPSRWSLEVLNGLLQAHKRGRIAELAIKEYLAILFSFRLIVDRTSDLQRSNGIRELALKHRLTSYDAAYLELAIRLKLPIATFDEELKKAAASEGLSLL